MIQYYSIANKIIKINSSCDYSVNNELDLYLINEQDHSDIEFELKIIDTLPSTGVKKCGIAFESEISTDGENVYRSIIILEDGSVSVYSAEKCSKSITYFTPSGFDMIVNERFFYNSISFPQILLKNGVMIFHSSFIEYHNKGILFCASSGTGKSTQADLWSNMMQATVINGDKAAVSIDNNEIYVHSVPFSGTSGINVNHSIPLCSIVILEQSETDYVEELKGIKALTETLKNIYLDLLAPNEKEESFLLLSSIIQKTKVYKFHCTKNPTAVECLYKKLLEDHLL